MEVERRATTSCWAVINTSVGDGCARRPLVSRDMFQCSIAVRRTRSQQFDNFGYRTAASPRAILKNQPRNFQEETKKNKTRTIAHSATSKRGSAFIGRRGYNLNTVRSQCQFKAMSAAGVSAETNSCSTQNDRQTSA